jgi:hypothetical protein
LDMLALHRLRWAELAIQQRRLSFLNSLRQCEPATRSNQLRWSPLALYTSLGLPARSPQASHFQLLRDIAFAGDRHGAIVAGAEALFPNSELFHIITAASSHVCSVFSIYPRTSAETSRACTIDYSLIGISWQRVNIARFRIDDSHSNSYAAAGAKITAPRFRPPQR